MHTRIHAHSPTHARTHTLAKTGILKNPAFRIKKASRWIVSVIISVYIVDLDAAILDSEKKEDQGSIYL